VKTMERENAGFELDIAASSCVLGVVHDN